jgi:hypothetical protein
LEINKQKTNNKIEYKKTVDEVEFNISHFEIGVYYASDEDKCKEARAV